MPAAPDRELGRVLSPAAPAGGRALAAAQIIRFALRMATAMVMARILMPADYGLFGMAAAVYGLLYLVRDLGASAAVQQAGLTPGRFDVLCRYGLIGGLVIGAACAAAGPLAAWFYHEPRLPPLLFGLGVAFPCAGAAAPRLALFYREQRVGTAAVIDTVALAASCAVGIAAAAAGGRAWALVALAVTGEVVACALAWRCCPWRAGGAAPGERWPGLMAFGAHLSVTNVASYFTRTCDQIVLGRTAGAATLGVYGRGVQATSLPMQFTVAPFTSWIVAELARACGDEAAYVGFFRRALNGLAHLTLPAAALCVAVPDVIVAVLFGPRWAGAVPVVRWLGLGLAVQPWLFAPTWVLVSTGRTRRLAVLTLSGFALVLAAVVAQSHGTVTELARAVALSTTVAAIGALPFALAATPARGVDLVEASWRPLLLNLGLAAALLLGRRMTHGGPLAIGGASCATAVLYAAIVLSVWKQARVECRRHFLWH